MKNDPVNIYQLFQQAVKAQMELGQSEIVINKTCLETPKVETPLPTGIINKTEQELFTPIHTQASYESVEAHYNAICNCQNCALGQTRNKFVYGVGNINADVMFIGEAPGADEDRLGEPFVGRAGQLLDKILAAIQFSRQTVYIANILKCRPPNNRDPLPEEMEQCFPYLSEQIKLIKPKLICALGRIAAQALLRTSTPLGKLRNQWHEFEGVPMMVTYHPAALLRFPGYKRDTWEDVKKLKARYDELK